MTEECTGSTITDDWGLLADAAFIALAAHNVSLAWDCISQSNEIVSLLLDLGVREALGITDACEVEFREAVYGHHLLVCYYILGQFRTELRRLQELYEVLSKAKRAGIEEELGALLRGEHLPSKIRLPYTPFMSDR